MAQLNPRLVRLQQKIENYIMGVQSMIDDVANRQKWLLSVTQIPKTARPY